MNFAHLHTLSVLTMTPGRSAIAQMAISCETEARERLGRGDIAGAEGRLQSADTHWKAALDHVGCEGADRDRSAAR